MKQQASALLRAIKNLSRKVGEKVSGNARKEQSSNNSYIGFIVLIASFFIMYGLYRTFTFRTTVKTETTTHNKKPFSNRPNSGKKPSPNKRTKTPPANETAPASNHQPTTAAQPVYQNTYQPPYIQPEEKTGLIQKIKENITLNSAINTGILIGTTGTLIILFGGDTIKQAFNNSIESLPLILGFTTLALIIARIGFFMNQSDTQYEGLNRALLGIPEGIRQTTNYFTNQIL